MHNSHNTYLYKQHIKTASKLFQYHAEPTVRTQCTTSKQYQPSIHTQWKIKVYVLSLLESKKTSLFNPVVAVFSPVFPPEGAPSPSLFCSSVIPFFPPSLWLERMKEKRKKKRRVLANAYSVEHKSPSWFYWTFWGCRFLATISSGKVGIAINVWGQCVEDQLSVVDWGVSVWGINNAQLSGWSSGLLL